jgi:hypothetical protein
VLSDIGGQAALTNPITGTGTTNFLPKFTGGSTLGNSQIFDNGSFVGIGTSTSVGNDFVSIFYNSSTSRNQAINIKDTNGSANGSIFNVYRKSDDTYLGAISRNGTSDALFIYGNDHLALGTGATERMRIASGGNVGIGTTADAGFRLDVNGTARITSTLNTDADAVVNGVNIGRGAGNISTNTRVGAGALNANTTGFNNTAVGINALNANTTGLQNTAIGRNALLSITTATNNTAVGVDAIRANTTGENNTAVGVAALQVNTTGFQNIAIGVGALSSNTTAHSNTASGFFALGANTTGTINTAFGSNALRNNTTASSNSAYGFGALSSNTTASNNTGIGQASLSANITGGNNTAIGHIALLNNTTGANNTAIGQSAGRWIADGTTALTIANNSIFLGVDTRALANNQTNQIVIGHNATGLGSNTTVLGNTSTLSTAIYGDLLLGQTTDNGTDRLQITGSARVSSSITAGSFIRSGGTSAQYLMADGSVSTLSNPITGTGTTNYLPKFTGGSTLGNSQIFDNGTNVGIGTTSPTGLLHIFGTNPAFRIQNSGTGNMQFGQWDGTNNRIQSQGRDFLLTQTDAFNILFATNDAERMRITSSGNVGIGTTSPSERLTVSGNVLATAFFTSSDITLKNIIKTNYNPTGIEAISYKWKDSGIDTKVHVGYSAQQVQEFMPDAVSKDSNGKLSVNYVEVLVAKIASLEAKVKQLEAN